MVTVDLYLLLAPTVHSLIELSLSSWEHPQEWDLFPASEKAWTWFCLGWHALSLPILIQKEEAWSTWKERKIWNQNNWVWILALALTDWGNESSSISLYGPLAYLESEDNISWEVSTRTLVRNGQDPYVAAVHKHQSLSTPEVSKPSKYSPWVHCSTCMHLQAIQKCWNNSAVGTFSTQGWAPGPPKRESFRSKHVQIKPQDVINSL